MKLRNGVILNQPINVTVGGGASEGGSGGGGGTGGSTLILAPFTAHLVILGQGGGSSGNISVLGSPASLSFHRVTSTIIFTGGTGGTFTGTIYIDQRTSPDWDIYTGSTSPTVRAFIIASAQRLTSFTPYFDDKLSWYPNAFVYLDTYALYWQTIDATVVSDHPDWVLRDGGGNPLYIPSDLSGGTGPEYAGNIASSAFRAYVVSRAGAWLAGLSGGAPRQFIGLFLDDVNMTMTVTNGFGTPVAPIDTNTGLAMTQANWSTYMLTLMQALRAAFPAKEIQHNSVWFSTPGADVNNQILASDRIVCERGYGDPALTGGSGGTFRDFMAFIDSVHALGRKVNILDYDSANLKYSTAGYLLTWTSGDRICFYNMVPDPAVWPTSFFGLPIGTPSAARFQPNTSLYPRLWRRNYTNGVAVLNEPGAGSVNYPLGATYNDETGASVTSVTLAAMQGRVLKNAAAAITKLLILHDLPHAQCSPGYLMANIGYIDTLPVDGIAIYVTDGGGNNITGTCLQPTAISLATMRSVISPMAGRSFTNITHNFGLLYYGPGWADLWDDARWAIVTQNMRNYAQALQEAGLRGLFFDNENYGLYGHYGDATGGPPNSLAATQAKMIARGNQVMTAMLSVFPNIEIIFLRDVYISDHTFYNQPQFSSLVGLNDIADSNELVGPFEVGFIQAAQGTAALCVSGNEDAGFGAHTATAFANLYQYQKYGVADDSLAPNDGATRSAGGGGFIPTAMRPIWNTLISSGSAVYDIENIDASNNEPTTLQDTLTLAMRSCEKYTWLYMEVWSPVASPPHPSMLIPPGSDVDAATATWVSAVRAGRAAGRI